MIYFTADTHFCHVGIIKQCNRPFPDSKTMNNKMIHSWNSVVYKNLAIESRIFSKTGNN